MTFIFNNSWGEYRDEYITVTSQWTRWRLTLPASRLFTQTFIQAHIKKNFKALRHWPLRGESIGDW